MRKQNRAGDDGDGDHVDQIVVAIDSNDAASVWLRSLFFEVLRFTVFFGVVFAACIPEKIAGVRRAFAA